MIKEGKYIGEVYISKDNYKCVIIKQVTFDKSPSRCKYKVKFEDGVVKEYSRASLTNGIFTKYSYKDKKYIGQEFKSKDGYNCKIIEQITFDKSPSQCKYKVLFDDGVVKEYCYSSLVQSAFVKDDKINYINNEFISKDGYKCKIIEQVTFDKAPCNCRYLVKFEDGLKKDYRYVSLARGDFFKNSRNNRNYIGLEFTSIDGYKCKIIKQVTFDRKPYNCRYLVKFEDGLEKVYSYDNLRHGKFAKVKYESCIGKEFVSSDGYKCKIVKQITFDKMPTQCRYLVKFEDGKEKEYKYSSLYSSSFTRENIRDFEYIGLEFKSKDGHKCKIIEQITFDKSPSQCKYKVKFEDGVEGIYKYTTLQVGSFLKTRNNYIDGEFVSKDGYKCKIIEQVTFDKAPSKCRFGVKYENGECRILDFRSLKRGVFDLHSKQNSIRIYKRNILDDAYHLCFCRKCNQEFIMNYEEIYKHEKNHILNGD